MLYPKSWHMCATHKIKLLISIPDTETQPERAQTSEWEWSVRDPLCVMLDVQCVLCVCNHTRTRMEEKSLNAWLWPQSKIWFTKPSGRTCLFMSPKKKKKNLRCSWSSLCFTSESYYYRISIVIIVIIRHIVVLLLLLSYTCRHVDLKQA